MRGAMPIPPKHPEGRNPDGTFKRDPVDGTAWSSIEREKEFLANYKTEAQRMRFVWDTAPPRKKCRGVEGQLRKFKSVKPAEFQARMLELEREEAQAKEVKREERAAKKAEAEDPDAGTARALMVLEGLLASA